MSYVCVLVGGKAYLFSLVCLYFGSLFFHFRFPLFTLFLFNYSFHPSPSFLLLFSSILFCFFSIPFPASFYSPIHPHPYFLISPTLHLLSFLSLLFLSPIHPHPHFSFPPFPLLFISFFLFLFPPPLMLPKV